MAQEGVKVGVVATEGVVAVTDDGLGPSVDARSVAKLGVLLTGVGTGLSLASELGLERMLVWFISKLFLQSSSHLLAGNNLLVDDARVVELSGEIRVGLNFLAHRRSSEDGQRAEVRGSANHGA